MAIKLNNTFTKIRYRVNALLFGRKKALAKIPRKKLEIKLKEVSKELESLVSQIQLLLENEQLSEYKAKLAQSMLSTFQLLEETQLDKANIARIEFLTDNLLDPEDFSVLLLHQMQQLQIDMKLFLEHL